MAFSNDFQPKKDEKMAQKDVLPPYTNRGAVNTCESGLRSLVDWVAVTFKNVQSYTDVIDILGIDQSHFREQQKGGYSYKKSVRFGHIAIYFDGRDDMGIHVEMSGQGCREFERFSSVNWSVFFALLLNFDVKISRLDIAVDDFKGYFKISTLKRNIKAGQTRSKFRTATQIEKTSLTDGTSKGDTIYFGSPQSMLQVRFYDKLLEQQAKNKEVFEDVEVWNRIEVQLRDDRAFAAAMVLAYEERTVGSAVKGILANHINFCVKSNDTNKSRWKVCKYWTDFLEGTEKLSLSQVAPDKSIEKSKDWIERQTTPTLALLFEAFQGDMSLMYSLLAEGMEKLDKAHLDVLNRFYKENGHETLSEKDFAERKSSRINSFFEMSKREKNKKNNYLTNE
jgi:phage replication initiation protein